MRNISKIRQSIIFYEIDLSIDYYCTHVAMLKCYIPVRHVTFLWIKCILTARMVLLTDRLA